jgi:glucokinase
MNEHWRGLYKKKREVGEDAKTETLRSLCGLPGSGKTTLARRLAPALNLPLIDKDEILERLFESKGVGDATWHRTLSRESDVIFQRQAASSNGTVLVSLWRLAGMAAGSGTPTAWLWDISNTVIANVQCTCQPELAAARFIQRKRHSGHLDSGASYGDVLARLRELSRLGSLGIEPRIDIDTSQDSSLGDIICEYALHSV